MGRFFQATPGQYVEDAMFELPYEYMQQALLVKDKAIADTNQEALDIAGLIKIDPLEVDRERALGIKKGYEDEIQNISQAIQKNPLQYMQYKDKIRSLQRKVSEDAQMGDIYNINTNKAGHLANLKALEEAAAKEPDKFFKGQLEAAKIKAYQDYANKGGYKTQDGAYNKYTDYNLYGSAPMEEHIMKMFKDKTGRNITSIRKNESGDWEIETEKGWEGWSQKDIEAQFRSYLGTETSLQNQLRQLEELGIADSETILRNGLNYASEKYKKVKVKDVRKEERTDLSKHQLKTAWDNAQEIASQPFMNTEGEHTNYVQSEEDYKKYKSKYTENEKQFKTWLGTQAGNLTFTDEATKSKFLAGDPATIKKVYATNGLAKEGIAVSQNASGILMDKKIFQGVENGYKEWSKLPANKGKNFDTYVAEKNINSQFQNMGNTSTWDGVVTDAKTVKKTQEMMANSKGTLPLDARNMKGLTIGTAGLKNVPVNFVFPNSQDAKAAQEGKVVIIAEARDKSGKIITKKFYAKKDDNLSSGRVTNGGVSYKIKSQYVPVEMPETGIINENFLVEKGILQFHKETENSVTGDVSEGTGNYTRSYKLAGSDEVMTFDYNTAAPAHQHNNRGENYFTMSATIGNNKVILQSPSGENIPGSIGVREVQDYWDNNKSRMHRNNMLTKVGGINNLVLSADVPLGNSKNTLKAEIINGKVYVTPEGKGRVEITNEQDKENLIDQILEHTASELE